MLDTVLTSYPAARKRLFLLDYDGTLAELMPTPPEAKPTPELRSLLHTLAGNAYNTVVVISGRKHQELQDWLGDLPLTMVAEHGLWLKKPGLGWSMQHEPDTAWKPTVRAIMERYIAQLPGCMIEEKTTALVWHNANARDTAAAQAAEHSLADELQPICKQYDLKLMRGSHVIEIQPYGYDKGVAATFWLGQADWDFVLAAGDDTTDEDMFAALPKQAITIHVGDKPSRAQYGLPDPQAMRQLLADLL